MSLLHLLKLDSLARSVVLATGLAALGAGRRRLPRPPSGEPVTIGVSGPLTGQNAQYGAQWKKGFDLALDEINAKGGVKGRPLQYVFEDSQADPRQTVDDRPEICQRSEDRGRGRRFFQHRLDGGLADLSARRAGPVRLHQFASELHQGRRLHLEQFGQSGGRAAAAREIRRRSRLQAAGRSLSQHRLGPRKPEDLLARRPRADGLDVVASEGYQPDEKDFRSTLVRVRDAKPDAIVLISYYADGALITRQIRTVGLTTPIVASGSIYSPKFIELAGDAANGVYTESNFFPGDNRPEVQTFVTKFRARYKEEPDDFNAVAYDTIILLAAVMNQYGVDRTAIRDGLAHIKDVPSVIYGKATFDPETRRVAGARAVYLVVKNGQYTLWDGKKPSAT